MVAAHQGRSLAIEQSNHRKRGAAVERAKHLGRVNTFVASWRGEASMPCQQNSMSQIRSGSAFFQFLPATGRKTIVHSGAKGGKCWRRKGSLQFSCPSCVEQFLHPSSNWYSFKTPMSDVVDPIQIIQNKVWLLNNRGKCSCPSYDREPLTMRIAMLLLSDVRRSDSTMRGAAGVADVVRPRVLQRLQTSPPTCDTTEWLVGGG